MNAFDLIAFQIISYLPSRLVYLAASFALFDIKRKGLFAVLLLTGGMLSIPLAAVDSALVRVPVGVLLLVGPQMLLARDELLRRTFICAIFVAVLMVGEVLPSLIWLSMTHQTSFSMEIFERLFDEIILLRMGHLLFVSVMLAGVMLAERRISKVHTDQGIAGFMGFMVVQCSMLSLTVFAVESMAHVTRGLLLLLLVAIAVCIAADAIMMVCMMRFNQTAREEQRFALLREELDWYLARYRVIEHEVIAAATLRHDINNQVNTIMLLVRQGDAKRALLCLNELISWVEYEPDASPDCCDACAAEGQLACGADRDSASREAANSSGGGERADWEAKWDSAAMGSAKRESPSVALAKVLIVSSQTLLLVVLLAYVALGDPTPLFVLSVIGVAVMCVISDEAVLATLAKASEKDLIRERSRLLEEQHLAQQLQSERIETELQQARHTRIGLLEKLRQLKGMIEEGCTQEIEDRFLPSFSSPEDRYCQHVVVNALVSLKAEVCHERGIRLDHSLSIPSEVGFSDLDLCAVFSNLLDNAIDGCSGLEDRGWVSVKARVAAGALVVDVENSYAEGVERASSDMAVTMSREHGWGRRILESFAQYYDGAFESGPVEGGTWRASIMLRPAKSEGPASAGL